MQHAAHAAFPMWSRIDLVAYGVIRMGLPLPTRYRGTKLQQRLILGVAHSLSQNFKLQCTFCERISRYLHNRFSFPV